MTGKPVNMGRPRDQRVVLRVLDEERDAWKAAAKRADLDLSDWLRGLANAAASAAPRKAKR